MLAVRHRDAQGEMSSNTQDCFHRQKAILEERMALRMGPEGRHSRGSTDLPPKNHAVSYITSCSRRSFPRFTFDLNGIVTIMVSGTIMYFCVLANKLQKHRFLVVALMEDNFSLRWGHQLQMLQEFPAKHGVKAAYRRNGV